MSPLRAKKREVHTIETSIVPSPAYTQSSSKDSTPTVAKKTGKKGSAPAQGPSPALPSFEPTTIDPILPPDLTIPEVKTKANPGAIVISNQENFRKIEVLVQQAESAIKNEDKPKAEDCLKQIREIDPESKYIKDIEERIAGM